MEICFFELIIVHLRGGKALCVCVCVWVCLYMCVLYLELFYIFVQRELVAILERLAKEGKTFPDAHYNPVVNIKFLCGQEQSESSPNNIAIYFTGKNDYRYYVHIDDDGKLIPFKQKLPVPPDDWQKHLEFTNSYHTPDASFLKSPASREDSPHKLTEDESECAAFVPRRPGAVNGPAVTSTDAVET